VAQSTNWSPLGFEAQTKNLSRWFWGTNHQIRAVGLSLKPGNPPPHWFWGSIKKPTTGFEVKLGETVTTSFETKLKKIVATGFEIKAEKTIATDFEAKLPETVASGFEVKPPEIITTGF
jgi:hypothetical protein